MKKFFLLLLLTVQTVVPADLLSALGFNQKKAEFSIAVGNEKIATEIKELEKAIEQAEKQSDEFNRRITSVHNEVKGRIKSLEAQNEKDHHKESYVTKELFVAQSLSQTLTTIVAIRKDWIGSLKERLVLLQETLEGKVGKISDEKKSLYTFQELHALSQNVAIQEDKVTHAQAEESQLKLDVSSTKKKAEQIEQKYKDKLKEQSSFGKDIKFNDKDAKEKSRLLDLEVKLAQYEQELALLRIKEKEARFAYLEVVADNEENKLLQLKQKKEFVVRMSLRIDQQDVAQVNEKLKSEKQKHLNTLDTRLQAINKLSEKQDNLKKSFKVLDEKYLNKSFDITNLSEWISAPATAQAFFVLGQKGLKNDEIILIEDSIDYERAQIQLEKALFRESELEAQVVESWYKIKYQLFASGDELSKEVATYQEVVAEVKREYAIIEDKRTYATSKLNLQNKALANIKSHKMALKEKKQALFSSQEDLYEQTYQSFTKAEQLVDKQLEITGKLIESYSKLLVSLSSLSKQAQNMITELQHVSLWQRSSGAISTEGLKAIVPEMHVFIKDMYVLGTTYAAGFTVAVILKYIMFLLLHPLALIALLIQIILIIGCFFFLQRYLPIVSNFFRAVGSEYRGAFLPSRIGALLLEFVARYLVLLYIWCVCFFFVSTHAVSELYPTAMFYLLSIPYLLYLSHAFMSFMYTFNEEHERELYPEYFASRLYYIGSVLLYASVIILLFREAFILVTYTKSELPSILLALYSIIGRILLLSLVRKEEILSIIPVKKSWGSLLWRLVNNYYYFLLVITIGIMILSDPHLGGYDNLVSYLFWGMFGSFLVIRLLIALYSFCRRMFSYVFFASDGETLNARFNNAKTWYGMSSVILFIVFFFIGMWLVAWFWGQVIPFVEIGNFFQEKRLAIGFTDGQYQKVSILDLIKTILFIPGGFLLAHIVDRFVLDRIFSVLLVDPGVHNAIATITYYLLVITVITLGLIHEGFGFLVIYYLLPLFVGMAFALREIFNDFIAYFVLLVQRPLKVGDYIQLNDEVKGVVRKITPRAVVIRRKRSFHLIVPNSKLMHDVITNWDYTNTFITFPDISVGIRYAADPEKTKAVLGQALDSVAQVLKTPAPIIRLDEFGPSGYVFMVRGYISSEMTLEQWNIASEVRLAIVKFLHKNNIEISFPVRVLRIMGESKQHQYLDGASQQQTSMTDTDIQEQQEFADMLDKK